MRDVAGELDIDRDGLDVGAMGVEVGWGFDVAGDDGG